MTDRDALLRAIIESPWDDTPRLVFADYLDENGEGERAEFVRVQVELPRLQCDSCKGRGTYSLHAAGGYGLRDIPCDDCEAKTLRRRERELWGSWPDENDMRAKIREECPAVRDWIVLPASMVSWREPPMNIAAVDRGFISSIRCDWQTWLRHHAAIYWHPKQECRSVIHRYAQEDDYPGRIAKELVKTCYDCNGTGSRPFVPTAQPIERVRLTNVPFSREQLSWESFVALEGVGRSGQFTRVKCRTCGGHIIDNYYGQNIVPCPTCHGTPPNEWECDAWPGVVFEMPEAERIIESRQLDDPVVREIRVPNRGQTS